MEEEEEEPSEYFCSMMNKEGEEKPSPSETIKELAMMNMNVTKEASEKRKYANTETETQTESSKKSVKIEQPIEQIRPNGGITTKSPSGTRSISTRT